MSDESRPDSSAFGLNGLNGANPYGPNGANGTNGANGVYDLNGAGAAGAQGVNRLYVEHGQRMAGVGVDGQNGTTSQIPANIIVKCPNCKELLVGKDLKKNYSVCQKCGHHFRLNARERIDSLLDPETFQEFATELGQSDPLRFVSRTGSYADYMVEYRKRSGANESVTVGRGQIEGVPVIVVIMDSHFIGGSIGSVAGERVTQAIERAADEFLPLLVVAASGGARMQEGMFALMQMAKTSAALARLADAGAPYISLLTDPTTGGVAASFAFLGDVILAEPGALIGFAGPRVIEQAIHQRLPKDAATAEFCLKHGMIDGIVHRRDLKATLARLLRLYSRAVPVEKPGESR